MKIVQNDDMAFVPSNGQKIAQDKADNRKLKTRIIGMVSGLILAHVCLAWALCGTSVDSLGHFHTNYWAMGGTFFWSMFFLYHLGIS